MRSTRSLSGSSRRPPDPRENVKRGLYSSVLSRALARRRLMVKISQGRFMKGSIRLSLLALMLACVQFSNAQKKGDPPVGRPPAPPPGTNQPRPPGPGTDANQSFQDLELLV